MAIEYRSLGKSYLDSSEWPALMRKFEDYVLVPYDDKSEKHIATIGIGVNLRESSYGVRLWIIEFHTTLP